MTRTTISEDTLDAAFGDLADHFDVTIQDKGAGTFASIHEILGVITEEYHEAVIAVHSNDHEAIERELLDLATACVFAYGCLKQRAVDW